MERMAGLFFRRWIVCLFEIIFHIFGGLASTLYSVQELAGHFFLFFSFFFIVIYFYIPNIVIHVFTYRHAEEQCLSEAGLEVELRIATGVISKIVASATQSVVL